MSDNAIRLFGKTIPLALAPLKGHAVPTNDEPPCRAFASVVDSEIAAAATAASGGEEEDYSNNKPLLSCSDTTSPEKQENKVCVKFQIPRPTHF
ncbi:hypothetical protein M0R45_001685 [Rubus argutus]|uniref:Uncharacterized protein n=1 Tax=Rubus argutus TaxID=59490 RepID=A0AAW1VL83_RUBAR